MYTIEQAGIFPSSASVLLTFVYRFAGCYHFKFSGTSLRDFSIFITPINVNIYHVTNFRATDVYVYRGFIRRQIWGTTISLIPCDRNETIR